MDHSLSDEDPDQQSRQLKPLRTRVQPLEAYEEKSSFEPYESKSPVRRQTAKYTSVADEPERRDLRRTYDSSSRIDSYKTSTSVDSGRFTSDGRNRESRDDDNDEGSLGFQNQPSTRNGSDRENTDGLYKAQKVDNYASRPVNQQIRSYEQTPSPPKASSTSDQIRRTVVSKPRTCVIDISIMVSFNGETPQATVSTHNATSTLSPVRSTALLDNVHFVDLDMRSPDRTARLSTDGNIRLSTPKEPSTYSNGN